MAKKRFYGLISLLVIIALRAVNTSNYMSTILPKVPYEVLEVVSSRIVKEVEGVNRVLLDCTSKPPATIEFE